MLKEITFNYLYLKSGSFLIFYLCCLNNILKMIDNLCSRELIYWRTNDKKRRR